MVVDIGAGSADIAVISLSRIIESLTLKAAGLQMDEAIMKYICKNHHMLLGEKAAEELKRSIGCAISPQAPNEMVVWGRCLDRGLPRSLSFSSEESTKALQPVLEEIVEGIDFVFSHTPEELRGDISRHGMVLTGGGSLLPGLDQFISSHTGIPARLASDPITTVVSGIGKHLETASPKKRAMPSPIGNRFH